MIRCSSFTHAFNPDQRLVHIPHSRSESDANLITVTLPSNPAVLIPGYYLLFIVTADNVPSEGVFVQVCRSASSSPGITIDPKWWKQFIELLRPFQLAPDILDRLELAMSSLSMKEAQDGTRVKVILEKIQILDDRDLFGQGEFQFSVRVHSRNMGGKLNEV